MAFQLHNPYDSPTCDRWLRGNLHCHSTDSDGVLSPIETVEMYRHLGYDFLCLSEHDRTSSLNGEGMPLVMIPGVEVTANGPHVLAIGIQHAPAPDPDRHTVVTDITAAGGIAIFNHPNWTASFDHFPQADMETITGAEGIEIFNGLGEPQPGSAYATDRWDRLLSTGRRIWGFAHDDTHQPWTVGRGWLMVQSTERSAEAIISALRCGAFYASTGATFASFTEDQGKIRVISHDASRMRAMGQDGRELQRISGGEMTYRLSGNEGRYVRFEALASGGDTAWSQPFFIDRV